MHLPMWPAQKMILASSSCENNIALTTAKDVARCALQQAAQAMPMQLSHGPSAVLC
jgi:hypothetical protein